MGLTESLVRTKSSILTCKLAESFGLSSFLGRAMLSTPSPWLSNLFRRGMKTGGLVIKVVYLGVGKFGGELGSVWVEEGDRFRLSNGWQGGRLPSASGVLRVATS